MNAIVLPVGHYSGAIHAGDGKPPSYHLVRMGWEPVQLSEAELAVWGLAHGVPAELATGRIWNRSAVLAGVAEMADVKYSEVEVVLTGLLDRGLVVEIASEAAAREFAMFHRLQPLLIGLGNNPDSGLDGIGIPGLVVALWAESRVFEVWQWAHLWPDLWSACEALAETGREAGRTDPAETEPDAVLKLVLDAVQTLVSHGAAYLDHRSRPAPRA